VLSCWWLVGRKDNRHVKSPIPLIPRGSLVEKMEDEDLRGEPSDTGLAEKKRPLNGSSSLDVPVIGSIGFAAQRVGGSIRLWFAIV